MKIAVTTSDGKKVDQHFGKAQSFHIYELSDQSIKLLEKREVESYCQTTNGEVIDPSHIFNADRLSDVYNKIKDCKILYTQQVGEKPKKELLQYGIQVQLCSCKINAIAGCNGICK